MKVLLLFLSVAAFAKTAPEYNLTLNVIQTKQVPFTHGAHSSSNTDCQMIGNEMSCNTTDTSFQGFQGVANVMMATASNGNSYMFECDAQWRWSHCVALYSGQSYRARLDGGRLAIEYVDSKGKTKEGKYNIIQMAVTPKVK